MATAERLRTEFGLLPGVRIAADERTSQVITQAPPEVQTKISQRLTASAAPSTPTAAPPALPAAASQSRTVALRNVNANQFEASLWSTLGNRLFALSSPRPQTKRYRLVSANSGNLDITIDTAAGQVTIEGVPAAVDACTRLVQVLDQQSNDGDKEVRLMPLRTTQATDIRKAAEVIRTATGSSAPGSHPPATLGGTTLAQATPKPATRRPGGKARRRQNWRGTAQPRADRNARRSRRARVARQAQGRRSSHVDHQADREAQRRD